MGVAKKGVRDWTNKIHRKHWDSFHGLKQANTLIQGPSANKMRELLKLNRNQLR
jgi:hypothetical protein